jgi:hypothetical protein
MALCLVKHRDNFTFYLHEASYAEGIVSCEAASLCSGGTSSNLCQVSGRCYEVLFFTDHVCL